jgi:hypothetical protein
MAQTQTVAQRLYDLLVTRGFDPVTKDPRTGQDVTPSKAHIIRFDYRSSGGRDYGNAVLILSDDKELLLFFGDSMGRSMESPRDKDEWYDFLHQLGQFATHNGFNTFSPQNISNLKHYMASMSAISESLFESYYGTRQVSYMGQPTQARLMIRHNRTLGETDARYRYVEKLFVETQDGERFLLPFTNLAGGRAMLEHVRQGGRPYDIRGQHIAEIIQEMKVLARFHRAHQGQVLEGQRQQLVEQAREYYQQLRSNLQQLGHSRGYGRYFESWQPAEITAADTLVENLRDMFVEQHIDTRVEAALPLLARIQGTAMKEADIFENWVNTVAEGLSDLAHDHEAVDQIQELLAKKPLAVGEDGMNVIPQLEDIIGYDRDDPEDHQMLDDLRDRLQNLSRSNGADADAAPVIEAWLEENGVDVDLDAQAQEPAPEPAPAAEPSPEPAAAPVAQPAAQPQQPMAEGYWQDAMQDVEAAQAARKGKPFEKNPLSHDERGVYIGDKDLAGNPVPKPKEKDMEENSRRYLDTSGYVLVNPKTGLRSQNYPMHGGAFPSIAAAKSYLTRMSGGRHSLDAFNFKIVSLDDYNRSQQAKKRTKQGVAEGEYDDTELYDGCFVRDEMDGDGGEVFRMIGDPYDRRVRIEDKDGRGWYISPSRLKLVPSHDRAVHRYFPSKAKGWDDDEDMAEGDNLATFSGPNEDSTAAMDHRGAVTDSFYEDLARIKALALSK